MAATYATVESDKTCPAERCPKLCTSGPGLYDPRNSSTHSLAREVHGIVVLRTQPQERSEVEQVPVQGPVPRLRTSLWGAWWCRVSVGGGGLAGGGSVGGVDGGGGGCDSLVLPRIRPRCGSPPGWSWRSRGAGGVVVVVRYARRVLLLLRRGFVVVRVCCGVVGVIRTAQRGLLGGLWQHVGWMRIAIPIVHRQQAPERRRACARGLSIISRNACVLVRSLFGVLRVITSVVIPYRTRSAGGLWPTAPKTRRKQSMAETVDGFETEGGGVSVIQSRIMGFTSVSTWMSWFAMAGSFRASTEAVVGASSARTTGASGSRMFWSNLICLVELQTGVLHDGVVVSMRNGPNCRQQR